MQDPCSKHEDTTKPTDRLVELKLDNETARLVAESRAARLAILGAERPT